MLINLSAHCHPRAGHDSSKDKGQSRLTHSRGTQSDKPTPLGLPGLQQSAKPEQSEDQPLHTVATQSLHSPVKKASQPVTVPNER